MFSLVQAHNHFLRMMITAFFLSPETVQVHFLSCNRTAEKDMLDIHNYEVIWFVSEASQGSNYSVLWGGDRGLNCTAVESPGIYEIEWMVMFVLLLSAAGSFH